jgi:hypothetical protein
LLDRKHRAANVTWKDAHEKFIAASRAFAAALDPLG